MSTPMQSDPTGSERPSTRVDRESRTIQAPAQRVFDAFVEPSALAA
jgi:uncharacterized protein YndB with AHSA1/START domain